MRHSETLLMRALAALDSHSAELPEPDRAWLRRMISQNLVRVLGDTGRYQEAFRRGEDTLRMAEELGHPAPIGWALLQLGRAYCGRGDVGQAIDLALRSLTLAREHDVHNLLEAASASLGAAYTLAGRAGEAIACLEGAVAVGKSTNSLDPSTLVALGHAYLAAGRAEDASGRAGEALAACRQETTRKVEANALHLIGDIAASHEVPAFEDAVQHYGQALAVADELGLRPLAAHCHLGLGKLYRRTGQRELAREHLSAATAMFSDMDMPFWLAHTETELRELR